nr:gustatory receptor 32 [Papilio dardanus]
MNSITNYGQNEILLDNFIEKDIQMFLRPLNLLHYVCITTKYSIKYNFITSNNRLTNSITLLSSVIFITTYFTMIFINNDIFELDSVMLILLIVNYFISAFGYLLNAAMNIIQSDIHVNFIIIIKNIKKFITNDIHCKKIMIINWIYVIVTFLFYFVIVLIHIKISNFYLSYAFLVIILLIYDLNTIYMIRIIKLLRVLVVSWGSELKDKQLNIADEKDEAREKLYWDTKRKSFSVIIDASNIYKELCEIQISYHIVIIFMQLLNNVQYVITSPTFNDVIFILLLWTIKNTTLLVSISFECEMLFITLKNTQVLFIKSITDKKCTPYERLVYKSLRRGHHDPLVACGMLTINASLPLRFLSVLTTYTAVLLQIPFS